MGSRLTLKSLKRMVYKWLKVYGWELERIKDRLVVLEFQVVALKKELEEIKNA